MKAAFIIAFASSTLAAAVKGSTPDERDVSTSGNVTQLDDIQVICGAPTSSPDNEFPASDYSYPIGLLLSSGTHKLHIDTGPSKCKQAACGSNGGAGVVVCNDEKNGVDLLYSDIGFFAQRVYEGCKHRKNGVDYVEKGQAFCPDGWNVILTDVGLTCSASTLPDYG
ncbi:uncharacterized protein F4822DRAFT_426720 [Hypoxylon trugodes]|uniref:uncharacterized protein n=1 Tax=Hypoxylon trugodes TaxID=326681 RepID=UPI00219DEDD6|nr:uncharacterized protein F4822DRAFT_426720 [Hypoxylon trugodes]KAI1390873.1 hypothetical protein F4822DRAFT_426720 [Hypoxylon trugodes]